MKTDDRKPTVANGHPHRRTLYNIVYNNLSAAAMPLTLALVLNGPRASTPLEGRFAEDLIDPQVEEVLDVRAPQDDRRVCAPAGAGYSQNELVSTDQSRIG